MRIDELFRKEGEWKSIHKDAKNNLIGTQVDEYSVVYTYVVLQASLGFTGIGIGFSTAKHNIDDINSIGEFMQLPFTEVTTNTARGTAFDIMSVVINTTVDVVNELNPAFVFFGADSNEESKISLYNALGKAVGKRISGYTFEYSPDLIRNAPSYFLIKDGVSKEDMQSLGNIL